jgi:hypothetical protein
MARHHPKLMIAKGDECGLGAWIGDDRVTNSEERSE